jgi:hypothetical protein
MRHESYMKLFADETAADTHMRLKNRVDRGGIIYVLTDGPDDDYAVMDLRSAIDMGLLYRWESR